MDWQFTVGLLAGIAGTLFVYWTQRTLMPVVNVRMEEVPSGSRELLQLSLEAENQSRGDVRRGGAWVHTRDRRRRPECAGRHDWLRGDPSAGNEVLGTKKLEPK